MKHWLGHWQLELQCHNRYPLCLWQCRPAPAFNGRSLPSEAAEEVKADTGSKLSDTGSKLGGGRVVFADD